MRDSCTRSCAKIKNSVAILDANLREAFQDCSSQLAFPRIPFPKLNALLLYQLFIINNFSRSKIPRVKLCPFCPFLKHSLELQFFYHLLLLNLDFSNSSKLFGLP